MRSRAACAATAKAFSLVISPGYDPDRAAITLAATTGVTALDEAVRHLQLSLFLDADRVEADAVELLLLALRVRSSPPMAAYQRRQPAWGIRTERQVTHPSRRWNSLMSTHTGV